MYHSAWEVGELTDLVRARQRLIEAGALVGSSDHGVSLSLYAKDPDGLEFEVFWTVPGGTPVGTRPLHLEAELSDAGFPSRDARQTRRTPSLRILTLVGGGPYTRASRGHPARREGGVINGRPRAERGADGSGGARGRDAALARGRPEVAEPSQSRTHPWLRVTCGVCGEAVDALGEPPTRRRARRAAAPPWSRIGGRGTPRRSSSWPGATRSCLDQLRVVMGHETGVNIIEDRREHPREEHTGKGAGDPEAPSRGRPSRSGLAGEPPGRD